MISSTHLLSHSILTPIPGYRVKNKKVEFEVLKVVVLHCNGPIWYPGEVNTSMQFKTRPMGNKTNIRITLFFPGSHFELLGKSITFRFLSAFEGGPNPILPANPSHFCSNLNPLAFFYCLCGHDSQSKCMKSHFPAARNGNDASSHFYPFRTLLDLCVIISSYLSFFGVIFCVGIKHQPNKILENVAAMYINWSMMSTYFLCTLSFLPARLATNILSLSGSPLAKRALKKANIPF